MAKDEWDSDPKKSSRGDSDQQAKIGLPQGHLVILSSLTDSILHLLTEFQSQLKVAMEQSQPVQSRAHGTPIDEAIHVVELLFNVLFYESDITQDTKILMARLQMIYVKIASSDPNFYHSNEHPARLVLSHLIRLAKNSSTPEDHKEIKKTVEFIIQHYDNDPQVFDTILSHFKKKEELASPNPALSQKRVSTAEVGKDLDHTVKAYIHSTLQSGSVQMIPEAAKNFIRGPWQSILYKIALGEGVGSERWDKTLKTLSEFVSTLDPNYDGSSQKSQERQKELRELIKTNLDTLDMSIEEKTYWLDLIQGCWHTQKEKSSSSVIKLHQDTKVQESASSKPAEPQSEPKSGESASAEPAAEEDIEEIELTAPSPFGKL